MEEDLWKTETIEDIRVNAIKSKFRQSLVERAEKRVVRQIGPGLWEVQGDETLGDYYLDYKVQLVGKEYWCSCHSHAYGEVRARKFCSHKLAVILYRARHGDEMPPEVVEGQLEEEEEEVIPSPQSPVFDMEPDPPIPEKFKAFYPHQWGAIQEVVAAFKKPNIRVVFLNAPTGSGKTLIAEAVRRLLRKRALYVCTTKTLQDQFMADFGSYARMLKGRDNYPTLDYPEKFNDPFDHLTAGDCAKRKVSCEEVGCTDPECRGTHYVCPWCHDIRMCPYTLAKLSALSANLAVMNVAYCLAEFNGPGAFSSDPEKSRTPYRHPFMIIDEADELEEELMRHVEITLSPRVRKKLGVGVPKRKTVEEAWDEWVKQEVLPAIDREYAEVEKRINKDPDNPSPADIRWYKQLDRLRESLKKCDLLSGNWVYTGYTKDDREDFSVIFRPVRVDEYAPKLLWRHAEQFLLMSATIIDPAGMAEDLGLPEGTWETVSVENTFPAERRPIYIIPRANVTHKTEIENYPKLLDAVRKILDAYPGERILVHTVSYKLAQYLYSNLPQKGRLLTYKSAEEREAVLDRYKKTPGSVIIAPSLDRGVDLKDDLCRVVIVAKIPFPNLGDKQVSKRLYATYNGQRWYAMQTVRTLVQMTGRGMRSKDDFCDIYILDQQFVDNVWKKSRYMLPEWWREAIVRSGSPKVRL